MRFLVVKEAWNYYGLKRASFDTAVVNLFVSSALGYISMEILKYLFHCCFHDLYALIQMIARNCVLMDFVVLILKIFLKMILHCLQLQFPHKVASNLVVGKLLDG